MGDYNSYLADSTGKVYTYSGDYVSDDGQPILCQWVSKQTDFAEQHQDLINTFKTIYKAKLLFEDLSSDVNTTIYVSTDGGATWDTYDQRVIGSGNSIPTSENYWFIITGHDFMFKLEHSSADKEFIWNGIEADFLPRGEYFEA